VAAGKGHATGESRPYLDDVELRQAIESQLNKVELANRRSLQPTYQEFHYLLELSIPVEKT